MPDVANEYDDGSKQRTSLYVKGTNPGDTALNGFVPSSSGHAAVGAVDSNAVVSGLSGTTVYPANVINTATDGALAGSVGILAGVFGLAFNGLNYDRLRTPAIFKHAIATAAGNTAVWTPAAGKKFRLMRFAVGLSGGTLLAVAGIETITFQDSAAGIGGVRFDVQVPSVAVTGEEYFSGWIDWGNGFLSAVANNVLNVNLGTATTAGGVTVMVAGVEE